MRGLSESVHAITMFSCLLLVVLSLLSSCTHTGVDATRQRDRPFATHRQRRDLDLEGLPEAIREKIAASRVRTSVDRPAAAPNCWVEVDVPRRVGGVCRRIENMPACSVNDNLYINHPDCM